MKKHNDGHGFNFNKITEYIYLGTHLCCEGHFRKSLLSKHIKADVNMEVTHLDSPFGAEYYLWLPTKDKTAPSLDKLYIGANFIKNLVEKKVKVYVHCKYGHGRSPTLLAAYLVLSGMKPNEAWKFIRKKRRIYPNREQIRAINNFYKKYK